MEWLCAGMGQGSRRNGMAGFLRNKALLSTIMGIGMKGRLVVGGLMGMEFMSKQMGKSLRACSRTLNLSPIIDHFILLFHHSSRNKYLTCLIWRIYFLFLQYKCSRI